MKRFILIALLLGVPFWIFWTKESFASRFLSKRLGCRVEVESVGFKPSGLILSGVSIENPSSCYFPYALEGGTVKVDLNPMDLRKKTVPIEQIRIEGGTFDLELGREESNWSELLQNFSQHSEGKCYKVEKLVVKNVQFRGFKKKVFSLPLLPYLEIENLGSAKPLSLGQVSRIAFQATLTNISHKPSMSKLLESVAPLPPTLQGSQLPRSQTASTQDNKVIYQGVEMFQRSRNIFS